MIIKTVMVSCDKSPGGFYIANADKVPSGAKLFHRRKRRKPIVKVLKEKPLE